MSEIRCPNCDVIIHKRDVKRNKCWNCSEALNDVRLSIEQEKKKRKKEQREERPQKKFQMFMGDLGRKVGEGQSEISESKYPALLTVSTIYKILAVLIGIGATIGLLLMVIYWEEFGFIVIIYSILAGILTAVSLLAMSEGIKLSIDIEKNTFRQNSLTEKLINKIK